MESYSVQAVLSAVDKNFSKTFASANKAAGSFGNNTTKSTGIGGKGMIKFGAVAGAATAVVSKALSVVSSSVGGAVARFDTLNTYPKVMKQMGFSTQDTNKSVGILKKGIDGLPTSLQDITKNAQSFAILTNSATKGAQTANALNDAFLASGASSADASRGVEQYSQMLASGTVDAQGWRTMTQTMPYALQEVAKSFGLTGESAKNDLYKKLQSGEITMKQLNDRFIELDGGAKGFAKTARKSTGGIATSFTNMRNAVTNGLAEMLKSIDNGLKKAGTGGFAKIFDNIKVAINNSFSAINSTITKYIPIIIGVIAKMIPIIKSTIDTVIGVIKGAIDFVKNNYDWLSPLAAGIAAGVGAFKLITGAIKAYQGVIKIAMRVQKAFNFVMAINPFVLIIVAIAAVVGALVWFFTQTKTGQGLWQGFVTFLSNAWTTISTTATAVWTGIATFFTSIWNGIVTVVTTVWTSISTFLTTIWTAISTTATTVWTAIVTVLSTIWGGIVTTAMTIWNGLSTFFSNLWTGISSIISGAWEIIKSIVLGAILIVLDLVTGNFTALKSDVSLIWNSIKDGLSSIWNGIKTVASTVYNTIKNGIVNIWNSIKSITISVWSGIKNFVSSTWNGIKSLAISTWNGLKSEISNAWNSIKSATSSVWNGIKSFISSVWSSIKSIAVNAANNMVSGIKSVWSGIKSFASNLWNGVKNVIKSAMNFDLGAAGRAIMNSFFSGLKAAWGKVKDFVGGIASWIRKHKGPIQYDRKLLIPAGNAIMTGLNAGLVDNFKTVQKNVSGMAGSILDAATSVGNLATNAIGDPINALNNNIGGSYSSVMTLDHTSTTQPANITIGFDKHGYTAYVDDINNQQGKTALLKRNNSVQL